MGLRNRNSFDKVAYSINDIEQCLSQRTEAMQSNRHQNHHQWTIIQRIKEMNIFDHTIDDDCGYDEDEIDHHCEDQSTSIIKVDRIVRDKKKYRSRNRKSRLATNHPRIFSHKIGLKEEEDEEEEDDKDSLVGTSTSDDDENIDELNQCARKIFPSLSHSFKLFSEKISRINSSSNSNETQMNRNFSKSNSDQKLEIFELSKSLTNKFTNSDVNESDRCGIKPKISEQNSVTYCELPFISTNGNDFATSDLSLGSFHHPETDMILTSKKSIQNESVTISNKILNEKRKSSPPENCDTIGNISDGTSYPIYSSTVVPIRDALSHLTRLDDFNVVKLSQGFFSQVFKVTHLPTGKIMVLKMNKNPTNRGNALKEIELLNRLNHRNIVAFMGTVVHEGALHPLLEYINGGTLEQLVSKFFNRSETMSLKLEYQTNSPKVHHLKNVDQTFIKLMRDVCRGMSYLHSNGYFHRDLASKNIFIRKYLKNFRIDNKIVDKYDDDLLEAVIGDFGFSTIDPKPDQKLAIVGSPYWLAPECLQNKWYNHRSDIFSFGVICCELNWRISSDPDFLPRCDDYTIDFARLPYKFDTLLGRLATVACKYEPDERPSFRDLLKIIDQESNHSIDEQSNESEANLLDIYCRDDSPMKFPKAPFKRFNSLDDDNQSSRDSIDEDVFEQHLKRRRNSALLSNTKKAHRFFQ